MTIKVLFVCTGNICRSPMAEAVFKHLVSEAGLAEQFEIDSAGTSDEEVGNTTHKGTLQVLAKHHIPHESRRYARQITSADMRDFDYILAMDKGHLARLQPLLRGNNAAVALFLSDANAAGTVKLLDVPDPWYTGRFDETYDLVTKGCEAFLADLRQKHGL
ncbi:MAG: low molecular weight protein-tyrosine-phosphatase [Chloroflexota bacterium]